MHVQDAHVDGLTTFLLRWRAKKNLPAPPKEAAASLECRAARNFEILANSRAHLQHGGKMTGHLQCCTLMSRGRQPGEACEACGLGALQASTVQHVKIVMVPCEAPSARCDKDAGVVHKTTSRECVTQFSFQNRLRPMPKLYTFPQQKRGSNIPDLPMTNTRHQCNHVMLAKGHRTEG